MTKGKQWTAQEETQLKAFIETNIKIDDIAIKLQKTPGAIILKSRRLGLKLQTKGYIKTPVALPRELPSIEETLKMLAGALKIANTPGLSRLEVQRIQAIATLTKTYKENLVEYINYREIETKLKEMEELNAQLLKERSSNTSAKPDPTQMA